MLHMELLRRLAMETATKLHCNMSDLAWLVILKLLLITLFCLSKEHFCLIEVQHENVYFVERGMGGRFWWGSDVLSLGPPRTNPPNWAEKREKEGC